MAIGQHLNRAVRYPHDSRLSLSPNGKHLEIFFLPVRGDSYPAEGTGGSGGGKLLSVWRMVGRGWCGMKKVWAYLTKNCVDFLCMNNVSQKLGGE